MLRNSLAILGWVSLGCAIAGAALPLVPATPFALLAAWSFARSSPEMHRRMLNSPTFGPLLRDWQQHRGIRPRARRTAFAVVAVGTLISIAACLAFDRSPLFALLGGLVATVLIARLRVISPDTCPSSGGAS